ncbi:hypothetical protein ACFY4M_15140, partial [Streptomyces roseolus]
MPIPARRGRTAPAPAGPGRDVVGAAPATTSADPQGAEKEAVLEASASAAPYGSGASRSGGAPGGGRQHEGVLCSVDVADDEQDAARDERDCSCDGESERDCPTEEADHARLKTELASALPTESLWSIAELLYGDGTLYTKIADANEGRTMVDGAVFHADAPIRP